MHSSIKLHHIYDRKTEYEKQFDLASFTRLPSNLHIIEIKSKYTLQRFGSKVVFQGNYTVIGKRKCDFCLTENDMHIIKNFQVDLFPKEYFNSEKDIEIDFHENDTDFYENNEIDPIKIIEDQLLLDTDLPFKCQEDCKGLCLQCGENLNTAQCKCEKNEK